MKIKVTKKSYDEVLNIKKEKHIKPSPQSPFFRWLMKTLSEKELKDTKFTYEKIGMEKLKADEPALFLMNHSSFTDLQIIAKLLYNRSYHIVMTNDGMIGKEFLMRKLGCIPTKKFITDMTMIKDAAYVVNTLKSSILMYPEASYSFDGTETPLPDSLAKLTKLLKVPVIMIRTRGAFLRDPLYNNLRKRDVKVSAKVEYLLSPSDIEEKSMDEINEILKNAFSYNHFKEQLRDNVLVKETFRADDLQRVLYKCRKCGCEGKMIGKGTHIICGDCGEDYELLENGYLENTNNKDDRLLIPDWYAWERECVAEEIKNGIYKMEMDAEVLMLVDTKSMYDVGKAHLIHDCSGFKLTGFGGRLNYEQAPKHSYSLYADYFWYEIGDMISIGDHKAQYYCFPDKDLGIPVAKARLATEEMFKM